MTQDSTKGGLPALVYKGEVIHERHEMLSLTDMWRAAGSDPARQPAEWTRSADAGRFIEFLALSLNLGNSQVMKTRRGKGGGTWAHWQVAMAYAKYLDPEFHVWCNEVVRERMEGRGSQPFQLTEIDRSVIGGIVKAVVKAVLAEKRVAPTLDFAETVSAYQMIEMAGIAPEDRQRGTAQMVTNRMLDFCASRQVACIRTPAYVNPAVPYRFPSALASDWLLGATMGVQVIRNQIERAKARKIRNGGPRQTILQFVPPAQPGA